MGVLASSRSAVNRLNVVVQERRQRRRDYRDRVLLVANQWDGSVQQFYHFLLGYFGPVCVWLERHDDRRISVRDCGPMNIWFDVLPERVDVQLMPPGTALYSVVGKRTRYRVLKGLDDPRRFSAKELHRARAAMLRLLNVVQSSNRPSVVVLDRATSESFYRGPESETEMSGSERRSVPNLRDVIGSMTFSSSVRVVDTARVAPKDQVALFLGVTTLVGQHGAGLAHMLWMPPGSTVVEIQPPLPHEAVHTFRRLADALGHRYVRVGQDSVHADVDPGALEGALRQVGVLG